MPAEDRPGLKDRTVALTGATGFIGARVLAALLAEGVRVRAILRPRGKADLPQGVEIHRVALTDAAGLRDVLAGADALVHLAYDVRSGAETNLQAFTTLLGAAEDAGVGRIVHASSVVVYDGWPEADLDETAPMGQPGGGAYRDAKLAMERRLMEGPLPAAILQPTIVYGPGSALWTDRLAGAIASGGVVLPEPEGLCNAVYVDDVSQAVVRALALDGLGQERFLISGPEPVRWSALLGGYAGIVGGEVLREPAAKLEAALGPVPETAAGPSLAARISALGRRLIGSARFEALVAAARSLRGGGGGPLYPDHHLFGVFTGRGACDISRARTRLGYRPAYDLGAGLAATAPYLRQRYGRGEG